MNFLYKLLLISTAVLAPIQGVLITAVILILADFVTGIMKAYKQGERIESKKLRSTVVKLFLYELAIICAFLIQTYMMEDSMPLAKIAAGLVASVEFKSLSENIYAITGVDFWEKAKELLNKPKE